jgi:hypothetical protein
MMAVLKGARMAAGLSGREVSTRLDRAINFAHRVETGERMLNVCEFVEFARACDADPVELLRQVVRLSKT